MIELIPLPTLLGFLSAGIALNLTPGSDVMFATASGIAGGPRAGVAAGLGVGLGGAIHACLAALGVAALVAAHPAALGALKLAGAGYLLWLAVKSWRAGPVQPGQGALTAGRAFRQGVVVNLLNPKVILFILAFLPQFTDPARGPVGLQIALLGAMFALTGTLITAAYGATAGALGLRLARRMAILNKLAALVFGALALRLVTK